MTIIDTAYNRVKKELRITSDEEFKQNNGARFSMAREIFIYFVSFETGFTTDVIGAKLGWPNKRIVSIKGRSVWKIEDKGGYIKTYELIKALIIKDISELTEITEEDIKKILLKIKK